MRNGIVPFTQILYLFVATETRAQPGSRNPVQTILWYEARPKKLFGCFCLVGVGQAATACILSCIWSIKAMSQNVIQKDQVMLTGDTSEHLVH